MKKLCLSIIVLAFLVSGCALWPFGKKSENSEISEPDITEQILYENAQKSLLVGNYADGIERLETLEKFFPFGRYAEQAQLELIYANFMKTDFDSAIVAADRFINLHPQHPNADYAYYMKGMSNFQRDRGFFDRLLGTPEPLRDVSSARTAFLQFEEFLTNYPNSTYAKDAQLRMHHLRNVLAASELNVAYFYMRRDAWISAANRAKEIIEHYPRSSTVPHALVVIVEANHKLGLHEASQDALEVLKLNFEDWPGLSPDGSLKIKNPIKNKDRSFLNVITFGLLDKPDVPRTIIIEPAPETEVPRPPSTTQTD